MTTRYRLHVDQSVCQGSGVCTGIAPDHFQLDDDFLSRPVTEVVDADEALVDAAECCPTEAITVVDADTGEPIA